MKDRKTVWLPFSAHDGLWLQGQSCATGNKPWSLGKGQWWECGMSSGLRIVVFYSYLENSEIGVYQSPFKNLSQFFIFSLKNCGFFFLAVVWSRLPCDTPVSFSLKMLYSPVVLNWLHLLLSIGSSCLLVLQEVITHHPKPVTLTCFLTNFNLGFSLRQ